MKSLKVSDQSNRHDRNIHLWQKTNLPKEANKRRITFQLIVSGTCCCRSVF